jgi:broad specificity phosphatase PhoE
MKRTILITLLGVAWAAPSLAIDTIYLVRHAEKADGWPKARELDALHPLNAAGVARAARLVQLFDGVKIVAVYASATTRALHTGLAVADSADAPLIASTQSTDADSLGGFVRNLSQTYPQAGAVLIVGHSNTIPLLLRALGAQPECDAALGISAHDYGLGIDGYAGLWRVRVGGTDCSAFERLEQPGPRSP